MNYDTPVASQDLIAALDANGNISAPTLVAIQNVLGITGTEDVPVTVGTFDGTNTTAPDGQGVDVLLVTPPAPSDPNAVVNLVIPEDILASASAYVFQTSANIAVEFNTVERVIVSGSGDDHITVNGDRNTTLEGAAGDDTLITSGGNDSITGGEGNDSISAGAGNDTIVSGVGNDTIDAGAGRDVVAFAGDKADYTVDLVDGKLVVAGAAGTSTVSNAEFISFNNGESVAVASTAEEATVLRLYQGILGRDADQEGADYWVNVNNTDATSLVGIANAFLLSTELNAGGSLTDEQFIDVLYANAFGRSADAEGKAYWLNDLANGQERANVAINIVGSEEAAATVDNVILITGQI